MPPSYGCLDCNRRFASVAAGCSHSRAKGHTFPACKGCNRMFVNKAALIDHYKHSPAHMNDYCNECNRLFDAEGAYMQHLARSPVHRDRYCKACNRVFVDKQAYNQHVVSKHSQYHCWDCDRMFSTQAGRDMHFGHASAHRASRKKTHNPIFTRNIISHNPIFTGNDTSKHWGELQRSYPLSTNSECLSQIPPPSYQCVVYPRTFSSSPALSKRNGSSVHLVRSFKCFFCDKMFKTPSALAMHVESGCHRLTRHQVTAAVHELKIIPHISIVHLIGGTVKPPTRIIAYSANSMAFNGHGYECYICHSTFKTLARLNQHMNSPTHDGLEFRCPRCASEFQLISGLVQHIESGCCGIARFNQIARQFQNLTAEFSRLLTL